MTEKGVLLFPKINLEQAVKRYAELNKAFHEEGSFEALKDLSNPEIIPRLLGESSITGYMDLRHYIDLADSPRNSAWKTAFYPMWPSLIKLIKSLTSG